MKRATNPLLLLAIGISVVSLTFKDSMATDGSHCPPLPEVSWWGATNHHKIIAYVNRKYGGNWSLYIDIWEKHLNKVMNAFEQGKGVVIPKGKVDLEKGEVQRKGSVKGDKVVLAYEDLGLYIPKLVQRGAINKCLASAVASRSKLPEPLAAKPHKTKQMGGKGAKEVIIGYQKIYNPWKVAIVDGAFEKATGYKITWKQFTSGFKVIKAMAAGKVQIGVAGSSPIAVGTSRGLDIELFWIVEDIGAGEALVARNGSGIIAPQDLRGKRIGVPFGSTSHFHALFALEQFGIDLLKVSLFNMQPNSIALAWRKKTIDAAFVWDPILNQIKNTGKVLITSGQLSSWGKATFDGMVVKKSWSKRNPTFMVNFVKTIAAADAAYRDNKKAWDENSIPVKKIVKFIGGNAKDVPNTLRLYRFPTLAEQASRNWLGGGAKGGAAKALFHTGKFLLEQQKILKVLPNYGVAVNDRWVRTVLGK